ncbi:Imm26 family immunity protein [Rubinisphaera sp.]|uniref:Imm26 family immunity protein n=1 Tax=Rubinisphaera sp. TaxID=2024857 RepID=UPI000C10095A|nr:Imm26 family immunity protein [Rubinisphaera sp.]MBV07615.1 hypothetical protein [Rubinisphaera sp.]HCS55480.1 hypothetical protein [Planctomycetaceae bacterium]|tara:strand:+ start:1291 stop:2439 length:1149 start_codon:yes stop_codon:yes gene_type:complete
MIEYLLTNHEREYFGLHPIDVRWEQVRLKDLLLFFDGDVIRKVICYEHGKQYGYSEFDYDLGTQERQKLLPASARGKPQPLTPSNILKRKPLGFSLICYFGWKGKSFNYQHLYVTNNTTDESVIALHDHGINSFERFNSWVEEYIESCPSDYLEQIDELREKKPVRIRYQPGDIFEIPFSDSSVGYGRILLDIFRLRRTGIFSQNPHCGLGGSILGSGLLVVLYKYAGSSITAEDIARLPTLGTMLMMHDDIYRGRFQIIGNWPVSITDLDFPEGVISWQPGDGTTEYYFYKGGMTAPLSMSSTEYDEAPKVGCTFSLVPDWIQDASNEDPVAMSRLFHDLRFSKQRADILQRCGLKKTMSYTEMVAIKGGITPDEFINDIM